MRGGLWNGDYIFLLKAVISLEALMTRSRLSWCSSSSARKVSNMGIKGDVGAGLEAMALVVLTLELESAFLLSLEGSSVFVFVRSLLGAGDIFVIMANNSESE